MTAEDEEALVDALCRCQREVYDSLDALNDGEPMRAWDGLDAVRIVLDSIIDGLTKAPEPSTTAQLVESVQQGQEETAVKIRQLLLPKLTGGEKVRHESESGCRSG